MRTHLRFLACIAGGFYAAPALAGTCEGNISEALNSGFVVQDSAFLADSRPVNQVAVQLTCDSFTYSVVSTTGLSTRGTYGDRGYGDEIDLTLAYNRNLKQTAVGPLGFEFGATYQKFAPFMSPDGTLVLYGEVARPFLFGAIQFTPFLRGVEWVGTGNIPNDTFVRPGLRATANLTSRMSLSVEVTRTFHLSQTPNVSYANVSLSQDLGHGWSESFTVSPTEYRQTVFGLSLSKAW